MQRNYNHNQNKIITFADLLKLSKIKKIIRHHYCGTRTQFYKYDNKNISFRFCHGKVNVITH